MRVRRGGHDFSDYFGDAVYGGRERALLAAQHARDELLRRIDPDQRVRRRMARGSRSKTGVVGVSREPYVVDGRRYHRYVARLQKAAPMPRPVKDPRSRKGISMARRKPRHAK